MRSLSHAFQNVSEIGHQQDHHFGLSRPTPHCRRRCLPSIFVQTHPPYLMIVILLFFFWPGAKKALEQSQQAENPDWKGALLPIGVVVVFVMVLIALASA